MPHDSALVDPTLDLADSLAELRMDAPASAKNLQLHPLPKRVPPRLVPVFVEAQVDNRLYRYQCDHIGTTSHWSEAASRTQGIPHSQAIRLSKKPKSARCRAAAYAVFFGLQPGVYETWENVRLSVDGVSGAIFQGYATLEHACAAFAYADARSWTRACGSRPSRSDAPLLSVSGGPLPIPPPNTSAYNPLHGPPATGSPSKWYIVYAGITPGIYMSNLECSLNTVGLSCAVFDSVKNHTIAMSRWSRALERGDIRTLTHPYTAG